MRIEKAITHKTSNTDKIYSKELFTKEFANLFGEKHELSTTDFEVLLIFLSRDQNSILYDGKVRAIPYNEKYCTANRRRRPLKSSPLPTIPVLSHMKIIQSLRSRR